NLPSSSPDESSSAGVTRPAPARSPPPCPSSIPCSRPASRLPHDSSKHNFLDKCPRGQKTLATRPCDPQPNRPEHRGKTAQVIPVAIASRLARPSAMLRPARVAVPQPFRFQLQELLPGLPRLPVQIPPETLLHFVQKMLEMLLNPDYLRHRV